MTSIASQQSLVIDTGAIVPARVEGVTGSTGDIAIDAHAVRVIARKKNELRH